MSSPVLPEPAADNITFKEKLVARSAVGVAFVISRLNPGLIQRIMTVIVRSGDRPDVRTILRCRKQVVSVSTFCAGEGCLPRSIATGLIARSKGYGVTWCTGVRDKPFTAHAWVEVAGEAVGELGELRAFHRVMVATPSYIAAGKMK